MRAAEIAEGVRAGALSPVSLAEETLARIRELDSEVNSFSCLLDEQARAAAVAVENAVAAGLDPGPLAGVPVSIKDVVWVEGAPATNGCLAYRDFVPAEDAVLVTRLRSAGAVIVGKTTNPELCFAGVTVNPVHGLTRNPWGPRAHTRRLEWRRGGLARPRPDAACNRLGRRRLDPDPSLLLRCGGSQANPRAGAVVARLPRLAVSLREGAAGAQRA